MTFNRSTLPPRSLALLRGWRCAALALAAAGGAGLAAFAVGLVILPAALVFPVMAAGLILAAVALALIAWAAPPETGSARLMFWDVAGLLTLIGLAAALFGEPEQVVALLSREEA